MLWYDYQLPMNNILHCLFERLENNAATIKQLICKMQYLPTA